MPDVKIGETTVTIERFTLAKATRVMTLLQKLQQKVPEISRRWAEFRREYAAAYPVRISRIQAIHNYGVAVSDDEWERAGQVFEIPGAPGQAEVFFEMAPLIYERAEELTLHLIGLIAMPNDLVKRYAKDGTIWDRVDEFVEETITDAPLEDIMELIVVAAEMADRQILAKARGLGDRAGNVARLFGWKTASEESTTSSDAPAQPSTVSVSSSPDTSDGSPTPSSDSPGTPSTPSKTSSPASVTTT